MGKIESFKKAVAAGKASVLATLKSRTTADDLADAKAKLADELTAEQERLGELDATRKLALFEAPQDVEQLTREIAAARNRIELVEAAIEGVNTRHAKAVHSEKMAAIEAKMRAASAASAELRARLKDYHRIATSLAEILADIRALEDQIAAANRDAAAEGRIDLVVPSIYAAANQKRQDVFAKYYANHRNPPTGDNLTPIGSPVPPGDAGYAAVRLSGYYPAAAKSDKPFDAPPLSFLD